MILKAVVVYKESKNSSEWFMKLVYEYEDKKGVHRRTYPKVAFPQTLYRMPEPSVSLPETIPQLNIDTLFTPVVYSDDATYVWLYDALSLHKGSVYTSKRQKVEDVICMDELIKPTVRKMTIEEIEEKR